MKAEMWRWGLSTELRIEWTESNCHGIDSSSERPSWDVVELLETETNFLHVCHYLAFACIEIMVDKI